MKTSQQLTLDFGEEKSTYSQPDFPVSRFPQPGSEKARKMTDTSGHMSLEQFGRFNRATSWAKTFAGLLIGGGMVFDQVQSDLEAEGYEVLPFLLPACSVNAPHRRDRIWIVAFNPKFKSNGGYNTREGKGIGMEVVRDLMAQTGRNKSANNAEPSGDDGIDTNPTSDRRQRKRQRIETENGQQRPEHSGIMAGGFEGLCNVGNAADTDNERLEGFIQRSSEIRESIREKGFPFNSLIGRENYWQNFPTQSPICFGDDGVSTEMDGITFSKWRNESIKGYGNARVPQVAYEIFKVINQMELLTNKTA